MNKSELKPAAVFEQFAKINQIPRPSKREEKMIAYLKEWGESHGHSQTCHQGNGKSKDGHPAESHGYGVRQVSRL